jgi:threonine/homoserine/homoserine lactone efflux protein
MDPTLLWRGIIIGFAIAAPVGPIGVLCIRRTLNDGRLTGFVSGLGAASADAVYGVIAAFGLGMIADSLAGADFWIRLLGGLFLLYLGIDIWRSKPAEAAAPANARNLAGAYATTFVLTITNPATILAFAAVFAGLGIAGEMHNNLERALLVVGVSGGSALWWLTLSTGVGLFRTRMSPSALGWINRSAGLIIIGFGVAALVSLIL